MYSVIRHRYGCCFSNTKALQFIELTAIERFKVLNIVHVTCMCCMHVRKHLWFIVLYGKYF